MYVREESGFHLKIAISTSSDRPLGLHLKWYFLRRPRAFLKPTIRGIKNALSPAKCLGGSFVDARIGLKWRRLSSPEGKGRNAYLISGLAA